MSYCVIFEGELEVSYICPVTTPYRSSGMLKSAFGFVAPKPLGGLWSSPYTPNEAYVSDWHRFMKDEGMRPHQHVCTVFDLKPSAHVLRLETTREVDQFVETFSLLPEGCELPPKEEDFNFETIEALPMEERHQALYEYFNASHAAIPVDWEKIAAVYDALHVSQGVCNYKAFKAWDVETVFILNAEAIDHESLVAFNL